METAEDQMIGRDLSPAQRQVAVMLAEGMTLLDVANALDITYATAAKHLGNCFVRLGLRGTSNPRAALIAAAKAGDI